MDTNSKSSESEPENPDGRAGEHGSGDAIASIADFMSLHDLQFVRAAYSLVLGRAADPVGLGYYVNRLRRGFSRISVVDQLGRSSERTENWDALPGLRDALGRYRKSRRLSGWKLAVADPELGRTPAIQRARALQNSIGAERQQLQESIARLAVQNQTVEHLVSSLTGRVIEEGAQTIAAKPAAADLRIRPVEEVRVFDLPPSGRAVLDSLRF